MTPRWARLSFPKPFLNDQTPRDASLWRFLVCLPGGALAGVLVGLVLTVIMIVAFVLLILGHAVDRSALVQMRDILQTKAIPPNNVAATVSLLCLLAALNMAMFGGFVVFAAVLYKRRLLTYWTSARRFRWRLLLLGLGFFLLVLGPPLYFSRDLGSTAPGGPMPLLIISPTLAGRLVFALLAPLALLVAAAAEEVLFRGWLLRHLIALIRNPWAGLILGGLIFSAIHFDFDPDALERMAMGIGLGYSALRLGGVEFPLGIHAGNNILIVLLIEPLKLTEPPHPWNWAVAPAILVILVAYVALTELVARWKPLAKWAGMGMVEAPTVVADFD